MAPDPPAEPALRWRGIAGSLLLHAAAVAAVLGWWRLEPRPEIALPPVKIILEGPGAAGAAGGGGAAETPGAAAGDAPAQAPEASAQAAEAAMPQQAETPPAEPPPPTAAPLVPEAPPPPTVPAPREAAAAPPRPVRKPIRRPTPTPRIAAETTTTQESQAAPNPAPQPAPAEPAAVPGGGEPGGAAGQGQGAQGIGHGAVGDGATDGPGDDYLEAVRRWLARYKTYPQEAIDKQEEGQVVVGFVLGRDGTVLSAWIERSSGVPTLDQAALATVRSASPLPAVPARYSGKELTLAMPFDYSIGLFDRLFR